MGFSVFKGRKNIFLGLDIGTESVKAMVFTKEKGRVRILGFSLKYFDRFGVFDSRDFERDVYKKAISKIIDEAVSEDFKKRKSKFSSVFLLLPPNILKGRIVSQKIIRDKYKEVISRSEEGSIYQSVFQKVKQKSSHSFKEEAGILPEELEFIDRDFLEIKIDGYPVPNLSGLNGRFLDFKILVTFLPKRYFQNVQGLMCSLGLKRFKLVHESELLRLFLDSENKPELSNSILLDIGGRATQVFLVNNKRIDFVGEFDIGGESFTQSLIERFGLMFNRARFLKHRYSKGVLSEAVGKEIKKDFLTISDDWFLSLKSRLLGLGKEILFPPNIFIFGGASLLADIRKVLERRYLSDLRFAGVVHLGFLYPKTLGLISKDHTRLLNKSQAFSKEGFSTLKLQNSQSHIYDRLKLFLESPQYTPISLICYGQ